MLGHTARLLRKVKSAIYCGHANESPAYVRDDGQLVCACPEDCYCKHDGGCKELRRLVLTGMLRPDEHLLYFDGRLVASCMTAESLEAARRLMSL